MIGHGASQPTLTHKGALATFVRGANESVKYLAARWLTGTDVSLLATSRPGVEPTHITLFNETAGLR
jgi:hypothetical protein